MHSNKSGWSFSGHLSVICMFIIVLEVNLIIRSMQHMSPSDRDVATDAHVMQNAVLEQRC